MSMVSVGLIKTQLRPDLTSMKNVTCIQPTDENQLSNWTPYEGDESSLCVYTLQLIE